MWYRVTYSFYFFTLVEGESLRKHYLGTVNHGIPPSKHHNYSSMGWALISFYLGAELSGNSVISGDLFRGAVPLRVKMSS